MESNKSKARRRFHHTEVIPSRMGMMRTTSRQIDDAIASALANAARVAGCAVRIINVVPLEFDGSQYVTVICEEL